MKQFITIVATAGMLFLCKDMIAQPIIVSVNVKPPYSLQPADYIQQGNNVTITMVNSAPVPQSGQVFTSIEGVSNSVSIKIKPTYIAPLPLNFAPGEVKTMTLNQLKTFNGNPGIHDLIFQGFDSKQYMGNGQLPEGLYKVCATVITTAGPAGGGGGTYNGCGTLLIAAYDAPIILNPVSNSQVKPLQPQFLVFNWTPTGIAGKTKYIFKLVDLTATPVNNPNDAFLGHVQPFFKQEMISTNSFVYDNSKIKLKDGNQYAVQIAAYDPRQTLHFKNKGRSQVIVFRYSSEKPETLRAGSDSIQQQNK